METNIFVETHNGSYANLKQASFFSVKSTESGWSVQIWYPGDTSCFDLKHFTNKEHAKEACFRFA